MKLTEGHHQLVVLPYLDAHELFSPLYEQKLQQPHTLFERKHLQQFFQLEVLVWQSLLESVVCHEFLR